MPEITTTIHRFDDLPEVRLAVWRELVAEDDRVASPYFHPEFTRCVAEVRDDVEVAVLERNGGCVGFLPFQRSGRNHGRPVGGRLNDYHGLVARDDVDVTAAEVVSGCRLSRWRFGNVLAEQTAFAAHVETTEEAPFVDLADGFEGYTEARRAAGSNRLKRLGKKARQLGRDVGPLRFEHGVTDPETLRTLRAWKSEQYRRTGLTDVFARDWTVELLECIHARRDPGFAGCLSTLHAGDRLVAMEFGMQTDRIYHSWFPAYDPELAKYSPGGLLLVDILKTVADDGVTRVDLGAGLENGKDSFASGTIPSAAARCTSTRCRGSSTARSGRRSTS